MDIKPTKDNLIILCHHVGTNGFDPGTLRRNLRDYAKFVHEDEQLQNNEDLFVKHYIIPDNSEPSVTIKCIYPQADQESLPDDILELIEKSDKFMRDLFDGINNKNVKGDEVIQEESKGKD